MKKTIAVLSALLALPTMMHAASAHDAAAASVVVHINNFTFSPHSIVVSAGQTIEFVNDDADAHTVTATDRSFDSGGLDTHQRWRHRFAAAGSFAYLCALHPDMKGTIVVRTAVAP